MSLKAFSVMEDFDGHSVIVFAEKAVVARRNGANELNVDFSEVSECKRLPWADEYAPGPVPVHVKIENGWWYECNCGCGRRIDNDQGVSDNEDDYEENPMHPVYVGTTAVYWNKGCVEAEAREKREREEQKARDHEQVTAAVLAKWPFATEIGASRGYTGSGQYNALQAHFKFPGADGWARWNFGEEKIWIVPADLDAWNAAIDARDAARSAVTA